MDLKPLITIKSTTDLSLKNAYKLVKKFHETCSSSTSSSTYRISNQDPNVAEDTLEKLSTLVNEIKRYAEKSGEVIREESTPATATKHSSKAVASEANEQSKHQEKKEKKRKHEKNDDENGSGEKKKKKSKKSDK